MRKGRDFIRAYDLTKQLRSLYGITRETQDAESLVQYFKAITILADPDGSAPVVISISEAAFLITDASWSSITYNDQAICAILSTAYELELPKSLVRNYYSKWKQMTRLINEAVTNLQTMGEQHDL